MTSRPSRTPYWESVREAQIARLEELGSIVSGCPSCKCFFEAEWPMDVFAPRHKASLHCESGGHPHCACDRCF